MEEFEPQLVKKNERPPFHKANEPGISWLLIIFLLILITLAVIIFGSSQQSLSGPVPTAPPEESVTPTTQPRIYTVSYDVGVFSPTNLHIHAGDTVKFKNDGIFPIRIVSSDVVGFDSVGDVPQGSYFVFTFAAKGTFSYHNIHNTSGTPGTIFVR